MIRHPHSYALIWAAAALAFGLAGCGERESTPLREVVKPVKTVLLEDAAGIQRNFPASIESSRRVELSFRVPGQITELAVAEGDSVEAGQVLARLDPTDFELVLENARALLDRTRADWERGKELVRDGFLSRMEFDAIESEFRQAVAAEEQAQLDLSYTELRSPINGAIARRYIQSFEEVAAGQEVFSLRDNSQLEVRIFVPESLMMQLALDYDDGQVDEGDDSGLWVSFPSIGSDRYPLMIKEVATKADAATQTFEARMTFTAPADLNVLPGMSAMVTADLTGLFAHNLEVRLPASAIDDREGQTRLWVYNPETGTASPREVEVGPPLGGHIAISGGVEFGDRVIVAGVKHLDESMKLYEMRDREQADR